MRTMLALGAILLSAAGAQVAVAQTTTAFRGVYVEGQAGGDRFQSQGIHDDKFGYGVAGGFDGVIADKWVVGPQFGYWRGRGRNQTAVNGGALNRKSLNEYSAGVRGGYLLTPKLLAYGTGGFARDDQHVTYTGINGTTAGQFDRRLNVDGYYAGGGVEYSLTDMFFVGAEYRYSNYDNNTARQRLFGTVGVRFK